MVLVLGLHFSDRRSPGDKDRHKLNPMQTDVVPWNWSTTSNSGQADCSENFPLHKMQMGCPHNGDFNAIKNVYIGMHTITDPFLYKRHVNTVTQITPCQKIRS